MPTVSTLENPTIQSSPASPVASTSRPRLAAALVFVFLSLYYSFLIWDIPFNNDQVGDMVLGSIEAPWSYFPARILNPRTEYWSVLGGRQLMAIRLTQPLVFKTLYAFFGENMDRAVVACRIALAGLLGMAVFWLLYRVTGNTVLSFFGPLFLLTAPFYGIGFAEIRESEPFSQFFLVLYVLAFCALYERARREISQARSLGKFLAAAAGLWLLGMLAIRTKEPEKITVPLLSWTLLMLNPGHNPLKNFVAILKNTRYWALSLVAALLTVPLIWHKDYHADTQTLVNFLNPLRVLFWDTIGWESEKAISLFNFHPGLPGSLFGALGLGLSWCVVIGSAALLWRVWCGLRDPRSGVKKSGPISYFFFFSVWLASMLAMFASGLALWDIRHMAMPFLPFCLLIFYGCQRLLPFNSKKKAWLAGMLIVLISIQITQNMRHSVYIRQEYGGKIWVAHHNSRVEVYKQLTGKANPTELDLNRYFYQSREYPLLRKDLLWPAERNLNPQNPDYGQYKSLLKQHGYFYFATYRKQSENKDIVLVRQLDCLNHSPYCWLLRKFSPGRVGQYFLYRVTGLPV